MYAKIDILLIKSHKITKLVLWEFDWHQLIRFDAADCSLASSIMSSFGHYFFYYVHIMAIAVLVYFCVLNLQFDKLGYR